MMLFFGSGYSLAAEIKKVLGLDKSGDLSTHAKVPAPYDYLLL
jgi:hypothetical protein